MKIKKITIDPDPYEPFRLAQGYRVVEVTSLYSPEALLEIEAIAVADEAVERT